MDKSIKINLGQDKFCFVKKVENDNIFTCEHQNQAAKFNDMAYSKETLKNWLITINFYYGQEKVEIIDFKWERQFVKFLDFEITNTGNGDGWVLLGNVPNNVLSQTHLGNFGNDTTDEAKRYATVLFMIFRPEIFAENIATRLLYGCGHWGDYKVLERAIKKEGLKMPEEITASDDGNLSIRVFGKKLKNHKK